MAHHGRVTILLADEDALRRDGLAAVLSGTQNFEIMGGVPDGEAALEEIRRLRPDVAVVDLNLPKVHGIELVRRVRAEILGTKVLILAGTADDEIIREVVRAGGDGYLLKFGPARHLIDAISYVRDGGQYFSPQLGRDGRSRHLLKSPRELRRNPSRGHRNTARKPGTRSIHDSQASRANAPPERKDPVAGRTIPCNSGSASANRRRPARILTTAITKS